MNDVDLKPGEQHPMAKDAMSYLLSISLENLSIKRDVMSSCAIEGNRTAEICGETLRRIFAGEMVSDRYLLGLAWMVKSMECEMEG